MRLIDDRHLRAGTCQMESGARPEDTGADDNDVHGQLPSLA
jgi:hypothetical protein